MQGIWLKALALFIVTTAAHGNEPLRCGEVTMREINEEQIKLGYHKDRRTQWHQVKKPKGVAIVSHGLNLQPNRMSHVVEILNNNSVDVLQLAMSGHGNNYDEYTNVTHDIWLNDVREAYCVAQRWSTDRKIPLTFVGYSLTGLFATDFLLTYPQAQIDKLILFSPAIRTTTLTSMAKLLTWTGIALPSQGRKSHRAHSRTPAAAYDALFQSEDRVEDRNSTIGLNRPTLIIMDKEDELVSYEATLKFIKDRKLTHWKFHTFTVNGDPMGMPTPHHLTFEPRVTGHKEWLQIQAQIAKHLFP